MLLGQKPTEELIKKAGDTVAKEMVKVTGIQFIGLLNISSQ